MNAETYTIQPGMWLCNYHCHQCGTKLKREKTHRVVTKEDSDYYRFHKVGTFPLRDYDVYEYCFKCPSCRKRISYNEQRIIKRIQKKQGSFMLSPSQIKRDYKEADAANSKSVLIDRVVFSLVVSVIALVLFLLGNTDLPPKELLIVAALTLVCTIGTAIKIVGSHTGAISNKFMGAYSFERESTMEKYHAYCTHNKKLIDASRKCYCFHCKGSFDPQDIEEYIDNGHTALCPKCGVDAVLPDSIGEPIDDSILSQMNEYWF